MEKEKAKAAAARLEKHLHHHPSTPSHHQAPKASAAHSYLGTSHHAKSGSPAARGPARTDGAGEPDGFVPATVNALLDSMPFMYRIDSKPKWALICLPTKAGSSMWKRALTRGLMAQGLPMIDQPGAWDAQPLPYNATARNTDLSRVPRFMLVRHPISRLLSAYLGKVDNPERGYTVRGWDRATGFRGFVHALIASNRTAIDVHFQLQTDQCGIQALRAANATRRLGYRYLRVEQIGHWYREVVCSLGLSKVVSTPSVYWRNFHIDSKLNVTERTSLYSSLAYNQSKECFVRTPDCGCELHCRGHHCNASHAGTQARASFASFNHATERLEDYYDDELAQRVNDWAAADLRELGYLPWRPGQGLPSPAEAESD